MLYNKPWLRAVTLQFYFFWSSEALSGGVHVSMEADIIPITVSEPHCLPTMN